MRAAIFEACGEPQHVLQLRDIDVPQPGPGQVRVRLLASPINPSDLLYVRGQYTLQAQFPSGVGFEGVGVVEAAGGGLLGKLMVGKRVAVMNKRGGNWAEQAVVSAKQIIPLAKSLPLEQAATSFVNPATAFIMTQMELKVPAGAWLLLTAANSTLGKMVVRLGQHYGFKTLCVVRQSRQASELQQLGADRVIAFDAATSDSSSFIQEVLSITGGGVLYAIDCVGGETGSAVVRCLAKRGRMLVYGTLSQQPLVFSPRDLMTPGTSISGFWLGNFMEQLKLPAKLSLIRRLSRLMQSGILKSEISATFPLEQLSAALAAAESPSHQGKVLLTMSGGGA